MNDADKQRHVQAGLARLEAMADAFDSERVDGVEHLLHAGRIADQPWLIAGVSDGMGLHTTLAALEAGVLRYGVGIYYEPPTLLETDGDGKPVSPVHYARYQNALALEEYARRKGADFKVMFADIMMAPQRGLKGDIKSDPPPFPEDIRSAFEKVRSRAPREDAVFIDSVAFGKWISPREGEDKIEAPTLNFDGELVHSKTKGYHARGYEETLDTMGRNHGRLLESMADLGWFGPAALTAFFTWAGGSQRVQALKGVYGGGALGDAKMIAERDVAAFRLNHGLELGAHAIIRLPAFLSAALMAIPGAGLFGMISRKILSDRGFYWDMPDLSVMMLEGMLGPEWVRENPIAQIELDSAEVLFMDEIQASVERAHRRVAEYRSKQPEEQRTEPIPVEDSRRLLKGLVPGDYIEILGRFRPDIGEDVNFQSAAPVRG